MSKDIESVGEPDDLGSDRPDPEEPQTWQHEERSDAEIDALDWADQHSAIDDSPFDDDGPDTGGISTIANPPNAEA